MRTIKSMLAEDPERRIFHLHVPKNAGSSIVRYLTRLDGANNLLQFYNDRADLGRLSAALKEDPHCRRHFSSHLLPQSIWSEGGLVDPTRFLWLSTIREPLDRMLSFYRYVIARQLWPTPNSPDPSDRSLTTFVSLMPDNSQCRFFHPAGTADAALDVVRRMSVQLALADQVSAVMDAVYRARQFPPLAPIHANPTDPASTADLLAPAIRSQIEERFTEDFKLYQWMAQHCSENVPQNAADILPIPTMGRDIDFSALRDRSRLFVFGTHAVAGTLMTRILEAGLRPDGFLTSSQSGILQGLPVLALNTMPAPDGLTRATILLAAEAYGPVMALLANHACHQIIDAFDFTVEGYPPAAPRN